METLMPNKSQLSTISIMLDYDIDNALNTIKENCHLINTMSSYYPLTTTPPSPSLKDGDSDANSVASEINNNAASTATSDESDQSEGHPKTNARKRWKILAKVLRKDSEESVTDETEDVMASVRRFKSFDVLQQAAISDESQAKMIGKPENWYTYRIRLDSNEYCVNIHHMDRHFTPADLIGFNNTGNICVWPSEEALTVYCLNELCNFDNKWVLELGGGMTCLSGLMIAKYSKPYAVHLTDGNQISVDNVKRTIRLNEMNCYTKCSTLKWENASKRLGSEYEKFDYILSADCLFFDEARSALVDTIWYYLSKTGEALVMAPRRGRTLSDFVEQCSQHGFTCQIEHRYNEVIWERHVALQGSELYNEDIHYPVLIKLRKSNSIQPNCC